MVRIECGYISEYPKYYNISIEMVNDALSAHRGGHDRGPPMDAGGPAKQCVRDRSGIQREEKNKYKKLRSVLTDKELAYNCRYIVLELTEPDIK